MGGDNFNKKEKTYVNPLLKALNDAKSSRGSTEKRLKRELDAQLDVMVSAYLETLGLEKKIADEAIKGGSSITVDIRPPENSMEDICITKEDETTGYKFSKPWSEFYDLLVKKISIEGVIDCSLEVTKQKWEIQLTTSNYKWTLTSRNFDSTGWFVNKKHVFYKRYNSHRSSLQCDDTIKGAFHEEHGRFDEFECPFDKHHPIHDIKKEHPLFYHLEIGWEN